MYLERIRDVCSRQGYNTYLPHLDAGLSSADGTDIEKYFQADVEALNRADLVVAVLNGTDVDSGTAWEIGYAYSKSIPVIGIVEDTRIWKPRVAINLMIVCSVLVNLNTHTKGAFYEAFEPDRAPAYIKRIHFCYTPKHGSWLNVAECELSCLTSQCLSDRRIGELIELQKEIAAWSDKTNAKQRGVDWQFRIENARVKLKRLYPKIKA